MNELDDEFSVDENGSTKVQRQPYVTTAAQVTAVDSGNYTSVSNESDWYVEAETNQPKNCQSYQLMLQEKEQSLFLALQDARKLRSELERLSKSEEWYKQELRVQKSTRLEALERLYTQERKHMQENQRLQRECVRLYGQCAELEEELEAQKAQAQQSFATQSVRQQCVDTVVTSGNGSAFEIEQQQALIRDQQELIAVLRKQKSALLDDLKRLTAEKDAKLTEQQQAMIGLEVENTRMTTTCKQLLERRSKLEAALQTNEHNLQLEQTERIRLEGKVASLTEEQLEQRQLLELKEMEIQDLQEKFRDKLKAEVDADEIHRLSVRYHAEINAKSAEITTAKHALNQLQHELSALADVQTQNAQQAHEIEHLNFALNTKSFELENLQQTDAHRVSQITELQMEMERFRSAKENGAAQLAELQSTVRSVQQELIALNAQYANVCALCERTRFELELCTIEKGKLQFELEADKCEIAKLREKLVDYMNQTGSLNKRILMLENELDGKQAEMSTLQAELEEIKFKEQLLQASLDENADSMHIEDRVETKNAEVEELNIPEKRFAAVGTKDDIKVVEIEFELKAQLEEEQMARREIVEECSNLKERLEMEKKNANKLQETLLKTDAALYRMQRERRRQQQQQQWQEFVDSQNEEETEIEISIERLKEQQDQPRMKTVGKQEKEFEVQSDKVDLSVNQDLTCESEVFERRAQQVRAVNELESLESCEYDESSDDFGRNEQEQLQVELVDKHVQTEDNLPDSIVSGHEEAKTDKDHEVLRLKAQVVDLRQELQNAQAIDAAQQARRMSVINELLAQRNANVQQLQELQIEWEQLLHALQAAQQLEENTQRELQARRSELEELNALFTEQNETLHQLQSQSTRSESEQQARMVALQEQLQQKHVECSQQSATISELQRCNKCLQQDIFASNVKLAQLTDELQRRSDTREVQLMTDELDGGDDDVEERLRILTKVLESEHKHKMQRYDIHIRTLLTNVNNLRRSLQTAERKAITLELERAKICTELTGLQAMKLQFEELRVKYEQSQQTVKELEQTLNLERKRFEATDLAKSAIASNDAALESVHEVSNLIDDYKKLVQQSAQATRRPRSRSILELIERSSRCVPNLQKLENSVVDLAADMQQFLVYCAQDSKSHSFSQSSTLKVPSLLDELRAATQLG